MPSRLTGIVLAGCAAAGLALPPPSPAAPVLLPHMAHYVLSLHPSSRGSDVAALKGRLEVRFESSCDGWRIEQSLGFHMLSQDETPLEHLAHLTAFEDLDGSSFVFHSSTWEDRELVEELSGVARRDALGHVSVRYSLPEPRMDQVPDATIFPAQHVLKVLAAARAGKRVVTYTVFDGSTGDSPFLISSVIGAPATVPANGPAALAGHTVWPVRLAYFPRDAVEPEADFEMSIMLHDNGVAGDMLYDYGDFAIDVRLAEVEPLPAPRCR